MPTQVAPMPTSSKSPIFLAAHESDAIELIESRVWQKSPKLKYETVNELVEAIVNYISSEGKDGNVAHDELGRLAQRAKIMGIFKLVGQIKNSPEFQDLIAKHTPALEVTGGNQMGTVVAVGATAKGISTPIKEWLSTVTDTPEDSLKAVGLTKSGKPAKGGKGTKAAKEKAPKKEKVAKTPKVKEVKVLPLPTIESVADLESFSRQSLQYTVKALKSHEIPINVKGNYASDVIKIALAKHYLGIENYVPAPKPEKVKGSKAPEVPMPMPEAITWQEVLEMSYKQLQQFCKVLRSNGLFEGNVGGAGSGKVILLEKAANAMRQLGHDIQALEISAQNPDSSKPQLERSGAKAKLIEKANQGLATHAALGIAPEWNAVMAA